jgi:pimeloyl-ACP methyl ester carboxylesterase
MLFLPMIATAVATASAPPDFARYPACAARANGPCVVAPPRLSKAVLGALLRDRDKIWWISGDILTVVARPSGPWAVLCCDLQTPLEPIAGTDLAAISIRIPDIDEAVFDIAVRPGPADAYPMVYRGWKAPAAPARKTSLAGTVNPHMLRSGASGAERGIAVYVPPGLAGARDVPVIYMADGGGSSFLRIAERLIEDRRIRPVILVGIDAGKGEARALEYRDDPAQAGTGEGRYSAHARFVTDTVIPFIEAHYPVARTAAGRTVFGYSMGGEWALSMAASRPGLFGNVIALSIAGRNRGQGAHLRSGKAYFAAGAFEDGRVASAAGAAAGARSGGAQVRLRRIVAGHSFNAWDIYWADALGWMFPAPR